MTEPEYSESSKDPACTITSVRLPVVLLKQLKDSSKKHDMQMSQIIRKAIRRELDRIERLEAAN